jgi:hypothetical protein
LAESLVAAEIVLPDPVTGQAYARPTHQKGTKPHRKG